jgi:hypothetical protein
MVRRYAVLERAPHLIFLLARRESVAQHNSVVEVHVGALYGVTLKALHFMQICDRADAENLVESQIDGITQTDLVTLIRSVRVPARYENRPMGPWRAG